MTQSDVATSKPSLTLRFIVDGREQEVMIFNEFPLTLGRAPECGLVLEDGNISRHHADIYEIEGRFYIRDRRSLNGVRLDGEMVKDAGLEVGQRIEIGPFVLEVMDQTTGADRDDSREIQVRPEATSGVLEVIRAIDLQEVISSGTIVDDGAPLLVTGAEDAREHHRKLSRAYGNLLAIMDFVSALGSYSHPRQICEQFISVLRRVFPNVENAAVLTVSPEPGGEPIVLYREGMEDYLKGAAGHPSRTVLQRVLKEMRAVYAVDARRDPRFHLSDSVALRGVRSMMCAPLVARGEVLGAVYVENLSQPYCFGHFDLNLLTVFSFHLAVAIELCRLLDDRDKAFERAANSLQVAKKDRIALLLQYSQSEKKFRALFEQSALGSAVINLTTGTVDEVNDGLVRMLGQSRRQLAGSNYSDLLGEMSREEADHWLSHVRRHGQGTLKAALRTSTGERLVALQSCRALRLGDNEMMVSYFIDVTAKERAEEQTRLQLQRVTALSELSQAMMTSLASEDILAVLLEKMKDVLPVDAFHVALREREGGAFRVAYARRRRAPGQAFIRPEDNHPEIELHNEPLLQVLDGQRALLWSSQRPVVLEATDPFAAPHPQVLVTACYLAVVQRGELIGVVCVQTARPRSYDASHLETLQTMVAQAAMALGNARSFEAIREQEESLRQLSAQTMTAQERERGRISRELHDGIGQQLTAMKYMLETMRKTAQTGTGDRLMEAIGEARELATQIIQDLRNISLDLRPTMLDDLGLKPTLDWFVRQYQYRCGIEVSFTCNDDLASVSPETATSAYRIVQEALGNVAKHSNANGVTVDLNVEDEVLHMTICDDGKGFDLTMLAHKQSSQGCSGVLNMKERAHFLGGNFNLETAPGKGTKLVLSIPIKETLL